MSILKTMDVMTTYNMPIDIYKGGRWMIVYGCYDGVEMYAVNELNKLVQPLVPYTLSITSEKIGAEELKGYNLIFIGSVKTNRYLAQLEQKGCFVQNTKKEGYVIKVCDNVFNQEGQMIILSGADENGTLYSVRDFEHYYIDPLRFSKVNAFIDKMYDYEVSSSPVIEYRGCWTWGNMVYDYRRYLDNMSKWKYNFITIWNDKTPLNAKQVVDYAHLRGIKVIWGFSWNWNGGAGADDPTSEGALDKWTDIVLTRYEKEYAHLGGDGIYFQTYTEIPDDTINGLTVADIAVKWVNHIGGKLLDRHPDLWLKFGLHATSVKDTYMKIAELDPRINITWEDVGMYHAFPYAYLPEDVGGFPEALEMTKHISDLRGADEDFGIVVKGASGYWNPNVRGSEREYVMGEYDREYVQKKLVLMDRVKEERIYNYFKYQQASWMRNLNYLLDTLKVIADKSIKRTSVELMLDNCLWEEYMIVQGALCAESLWNPYESDADIIQKVSITRDVYFM